MKYINFVDLLKQTDWPEHLTQDQHEQLVREKLQRAQIYKILHSLESHADFTKEKPCSTQP